MLFLVFAAVAAFGKAAVLSDDFFAAAAIFAVNLITIHPELYKILDYIQLQSLQGGSLATLNLQVYIVGILYPLRACNSGNERCRKAKNLATCRKSGGSKSTTGYSGRSAKLHHGLWAVLDVNHVAQE